MMKKGCAALLCAALPCVAMADEPRYTYVEGGYQYIDLDDFDVDGDGLGLGGSFGITDRVHLAARYSDLDLDRGLDATSFNLGIGGNLPLEQSLHLVGEIGYASAEIDTPFGDFDDDGYYLSGGLRWMVAPNVELSGLVDYVDLDDSGDDTSLTLGGLYHITPDFAVGASVDFSDDATGYNLGVRYYFPGL